MKSSSNSTITHVEVATWVMGPLWKPLGACTVKGVCLVMKANIFEKSLVLAAKNLLYRKSKRLMAFSC